PSPPSGRQATSRERIVELVVWHSSCLEIRAVLHEQLDLAVAHARLDSRQVWRSRLQAIEQDLARKAESRLVAWAAQALVGVVRLELAAQVRAYAGNRADLAAIVH